MTPPRGGSDWLFIGFVTGAVVALLVRFAS
jgi:hypothetical protein